MTQTITGVVVHTQMGGDFTDGESKTDGAGYTYDCEIAMPFPNTNNPPVDVYVTPPSGPYPTEPTYTWIPRYKAVAVGIDHSGSTLIIWARTHQTDVQGARIIATEKAFIPNVWHVTQADIEAEGGAGAYVPSGDGGGGGGGVTGDEVELRVRSVLGLDETVGGETLAHRISGREGDYRQGFEDKAKDAFTELFTDQDSRGTRFRDAFFQAVKNANAGVQANILGGQDSWGQARRTEMVNIVKEGVQGTK